MRLRDKKILVTGGSRGIGAGIVEKLAAEGARVAFTYTSRPDAAELVLKKIGGEHMMLEMNIASEESIENGFKNVLEKFGSLDGLVNNAGITKDQLLWRMKTEDFDQVVQTNLRGAFICTRAAVKTMLRARKGSIVNITSVIAHSGNAGQANYAASKGGLESFSKSIAQEVGSRSIRVNCIAPGFIVTDMTETLPEDQKKALLDKIPLARMGAVEDIASATSFLLSDEAAYITGQTLHVNGGMYM